MSPEIARSSGRLVLDLDRCQGYANCVIAAPDLFDIDDDTGLSILLVEQPNQDQLAAAQDAVRQCPAEAIRLEP